MSLSSIDNERSAKVLFNTILMGVPKLHFVLRPDRPSCSISVALFFTSSPVRTNYGSSGGSELKRQHSGDIFIHNILKAIGKDVVVVVAGVVG